MTEFLLFRLYGPIAAWGDTAVGEYRPSYSHPGKSAILGLLAATRGIRRDDERTHRALAGAYSVAVRIDAAGSLLRDYHTTQVPPADRKIKRYTRRDELLADKLNTILSSRDYYCDAVYTVCVASNSHELSPFTPDELKQSLLRPVFVPYLGRKSCPPALPLEPQLITAKSVKAAFDAVEFSADFLAQLVDDSFQRYFWEAGMESGLDPIQTTQRRDVPLSRLRWQFGERQEHYASVSKGDD